MDNKNIWAPSRQSAKETLIKIGEEANEVGLKINRTKRDTNRLQLRTS